jgi:DNA-binding response OmpR family regulator
VARVAAVLRRTTVGDRQRGDCIRVGNLEIDVASHAVSMNGRDVRLTPLEFRILRILAANAGRVVPYERLIEFAWGHEGGSRSGLKIRIHSIRDKVGLPHGEVPGIKAVIGTGYTLQGA